MRRCAPATTLNKRHWNTIEIDGSLDDRFIADLIEDSYDLVVAGLPKRIQAELGWPGRDVAGGAVESARPRSTS